MTAQELKTGETSVEWSEDFHDIVRLVDEKWQRDPPKIPEGPPKIDKNAELLLEGTQVQTKLLEPISVLGKKLHGKFRIGDIKWDPKVRIIKKFILSPEQPPTYLLDGPHGRERYVPERIIKHRTRKGQLQYLVKWERYPEDESTWEPADRLQEDVPNLVHATPEWVENWLNAPIKETGHTINASIERTDIFQIHEIARNIIYHLDQLAEEDYWKAVMDYKNSDEELEHAFKKYLGTNRALKDKLYKKFMDLANKKDKAFAYQVEIEKIMLQGGFAYKNTEKDHIFYNIRMLADGLDPYEIPTFGEPEDPVWYSDYWGNEDPDDPANWQSGPNEPSDSDEDLSDDSSDFDAE
ncbi:hypothetical protein RclHR1_20170007 [Rhizophagus clarus]|uniref:Chromo domain-containing protein n=1 Tax=Rhizophagus clarus TaxID=94130 RepID=A0A2Z6QQX4_9GLOM|nr:hypothetical protein RclHR1_20170007 [Rhizophagus clarus]